MEDVSQHISKVKTKTSSHQQQPESTTFSINLGLPKLRRIFIFKKTETAVEAVGGTSAGVLG